MSDRKMVLVRWADAHAHEDGWTYLHEIEDTGEYIVSSVGWRLSPGDGGKEDHISLAQSIGTDDAADHIIHIPEAMVRTLSELASFYTAPETNP